MYVTLNEENMLLTEKHLTLKMLGVVLSQNLVR